MQVKIEISEKATVDGACSVLLARTRGLVRERDVILFLFGLVVLYNLDFFLV